MTEFLKIDEKYFLWAVNKKTGLKRLGANHSTWRVPGPDAEAGFFFFFFH